MIGPLKGSSKRLFTWSFHPRVRDLGHCVNSKDIFMDSALHCSSSPDFSRTDEVPSLTRLTALSAIPLVLADEV